MGYSHNISRNWLLHDGKVKEDGTITYRGVVIDKKVVPLVAYADAKRFWDKDVHLSAQDLSKAAMEFGKGAYDFFIGDDIKTLQDPNAPMLAKVLSGGSLVLMAVPGAAIGRTAGKAVLKATATQVLERNVVWIGAGLLGVTAAGAAQMHSDDLMDFVDQFIPEKYRTLPKTEHNPNEDKCWNRYNKDHLRCVTRFENNPVRYTRCESTAIVRLGDCLSGKVSTLQPVNPL